MAKNDIIDIDALIDDYEAGLLSQAASSQAQQQAIADLDLQKLTQFGYQPQTEQGFNPSQFSPVAPFMEDRLRKQQAIEAGIKADDPYFIENYLSTAPGQVRAEFTGVDFTGGSSGSINVSKAWPDGHDVIVGLVAHNNLLVIFGEHSLLVYQNADTPAVMSLADTVAGIGGIDRGSIQSMGTDVLFLSDSGLRSLGRTIQEKSLPLSDLSKNVKTDLIVLVTAETDPIQSIYSPENSFYLLCFPSQQTVLCFDLKIKLENNAYRVTRWTSVKHKSFARDKDGTLYIGSTDGVGKYDGYKD